MQRKEQWGNPGNPKERKEKAEAFLRNHKEWSAAAKLQRAWKRSKGRVQEDLELEEELEFQRWSELQQAKFNGLVQETLCAKEAKREQEYHEKLDAVIDGYTYGSIRERTIQLTGKANSILTASVLEDAKEAYSRKIVKLEKEKSAERKQQHVNASTIQSTGSSSNAQEDEAMIPIYALGLTGGEPLWVNKGTKREVLQQLEDRHAINPPSTTQYTDIVEVRRLENGTTIEIDVSDTWLICNEDLGGPQGARLHIRFRGQGGGAEGEEGTKLKVSDSGKEKLMAIAESHMRTAQQLIELAKEPAEATKETEQKTTEDGEEQEEQDTILGALDDMRLDEHGAYPESNVIIIRSGAEILTRQKWHRNPDSSLSCGELDLLGGYHETAGLTPEQLAHQQLQAQIDIQIDNLEPQSHIIDNVQIPDTGERMDVHVFTYSCYSIAKDSIPLGDEAQKAEHGQDTLSWLTVEQIQATGNMHPNIKYILEPLGETGETGEAMGHHNRSSDGLKQLHVYLFAYTTSLVYLHAPITAHSDGLITCHKGRAVANLKADAIRVLQKSTNTKIGEVDEELQVVHAAATFDEEDNTVLEISVIMQATPGTEVHKLADYTPDMQAVYYDPDKQGNPMFDKFTWKTRERINLSTWRA